MLNQPRSAAVFDALGEATRRAIIERLSNGPSTVSALAEPLGITLAAVLQHLQVLERAALVTTNKQGRVRTCRLDQSGLAVAESWLEQRRTSLERKLDRLGEVLGE